MVILVPHHPKRLSAYTDGAVRDPCSPCSRKYRQVVACGMQMSYPLGTDEGELLYPIGVANLAELTGCSFNREAWLDTPQYIYIGDEDRPEPGSNGHRSFANLPPEDVQKAHPDDRPYGMPDLIDDIFGVQNIEERFKVSRAAYENVDAAVTVTVYEEYGHTSRPAIDDLVEFHQNEMQNLDTSSVVSEEYLAESVEQPSTTSTAVEQPDTSDTTTTAPSAADTATKASDSGGTTSESTAGEVPGFGVGAALSAIAGTTYLLKRRLESEK